MSEAFSRAALLAAMQGTAVRPPRALQIPVWGTVYIRALTVADVDSAVEHRAASAPADAAVSATPGAPKPSATRLARAAAQLLCEPDGKRIFDPDNPTDLAHLNAQPWELLRAVVNAGDAFNDLTGEDAKNA